MEHTNSFSLEENRDVNEAGRCIRKHPPGMNMNENGPEAVDR